MRFFKKQNLFEKNARKYIDDKFTFLIERGYRCDYLSRNGEEEFVFIRRTVHIELYKVNWPFGFDVVISDGNYWGEKRKNIIEILNINIDDVKLLSPIETVDYYAEIVKSNIERIEKYINN